MLFTSRVFALYALIVIPLFHAIPDRWRPAFLIAASWLFYAWGDPLAVPLVALTIVIGWYGAMRADVEDPVARRRWTAFGAGLPLLSLLAFKYWNFALSTVSSLSGLAGHPIDTSGARSSGWLPLGISFYTFHVVSYVLDVHRRKGRAERSVRDVMLYVMFFPQLVAGPVERATWLIPQYQAPVRLTRERVRDGVLLILVGFVKKAVIADRLAAFIAPHFHAPERSALTAWVGVLLFTTDIYCDFSAYSDIAIGTARVMGYDIRPNFDLPFVVPSIPERWRRWHISMGAFFRDFVYVPLGGGREGWWKAQRNVLVVMFLSGLWHGASANFVVWGVLNGLTMVAHAACLPLLDRAYAAFAPRAVTRWLWFYAASALTMLTIASINIFFRSDSWDVARSYVVAMYASPTLLAADLASGQLPSAYVTGLAWMAAVLLAHEVERHGQIRRRLVDSRVGWALACLGLLAAVLLYGTSGTRRFIYFQF